MFKGERDMMKGWIGMLKNLEIPMYGKIRDREESGTI
jgi:hypothetical protein